MRAIDRHEDAIVAVLDAVDYDGMSYWRALKQVANANGLRSARLDQLVRTWCAIAGIEVPTGNYSFHVSLHRFDDGGTLAKWSAMGPVNQTATFVRFIGSGTAGTIDEAEAAAINYIAERTPS